MIEHANSGTSRSTNEGPQGQSIVGSHIAKLALLLSEYVIKYINILPSHMVWKGHKST